MSGILVLAVLATGRSQPPDYSEPYTVTTVCGVSDSLTGGRNGQGKAARFYDPSGLTVDSSGNIYVADAANYVVRKITPAGVVTTLAGKTLAYGDKDGTGSAARFLYPTDVAVDGKGNVYVVDPANANIRKITPQGKVTTVAGPHTGTFPAAEVSRGIRFNNPFTITLDRSGNIYVSDCGNHVIRKVTPTGIVTTFAGAVGEAGSADGTRATARFETPYGLQFDSAGNLYVADNGTNTVRKISTSGKVTTVAGRTEQSGLDDGPVKSTPLGNAIDVAVDAAGNLYIADYGRNAIRKVGKSGGKLTTFAGGRGYGDPNSLAGVAWDGTGAEARFNYPGALTIDKSGNLYVADLMAQAIRKITPKGVVTTIAGPVGAITGGYVGTVAVDADGAVFVYAGSGRTIKKIDAAGAVSKYSVPATHPLLQGAGGVALATDAQSLFYPDPSRHTIHQINSDGIDTILAGVLFTPGGHDGAATEATFSYPRAVRLERSGSLLVMDGNNRRLREISADGVVSTRANVFEYPGGGSLVPSSMAVDPLGNVYVADEATHVIRKIAPDGSASIYAGVWNQPGPPVDDLRAAAMFRQPTGVAMDDGGNLFVADAGNHVIRKISHSGRVTTIAGWPDSGGWTDGTGILAQFGLPMAIAVDGTGTLYIEDAGTIRMATTEAPQISMIVDQTFPKNGAARTFSFRVHALKTPGTKLKVSVASTNPSVVPVSRLKLGGAGNNRTLSIHPVAGTIGTATVTLTVSDGKRTADTMIVVAVRNAPTIASVAAQKVSKNQTSALIRVAVADADTNVDKLQLSAVSSNTKLLPSSGIALGGSGANRTVKLTPAKNQTGSAKVTLTVSDGALTNKTSFTVTVK